MSRFSYIAKDLPIKDAGQSTKQIPESILPFQNWIDRIEIQSNLANHSRRTHSKIGQRNTSFTNGPYAEIKESIGKFLPSKKRQEN
jgi:hypothetical protein